MFPGMDRSFPGTNIIFRGKDLLLSATGLYSYSNLMNTQSYFNTSLLLVSTLELQAIQASRLGLNPGSETKISLVVTIASYLETYASLN